MGLLAEVVLGIVVSLFALPLSWIVHELSRHWEADAATDNVLRRFDGSQDPALAELVDYASREKQRALSGTGAGRRRSKRHRSR
jgi:hypothetical protein